VPAPDWIECGLARLLRGEVDIVGGHVELTVSDPPSLAELVDIGRGYLDQRAMVEREGYAATANLWIRRELVERVGGFRQIWSGQDQDRDLVERAVAAGARLAYAPEVVVEHPARATLKELARKEYRLAKGAVEVRRLSVGSAAGQPQPWTRAKLYLPWRHRESALRLERRGVRLRGFRRLQLRAAQYVCLQLLQAAGSVAGDVRFRRRSAH
jgi:GT2 family glycosyltransferase